ncbi:hypothetical protein COM97_27165 [Bacillus thuringiensis]|uniref:hypothetical protein n=1 Tax=Bacillus thuringiensis TaxID=1428 RepID=UPI000BEE6E6A|nr:hypothetical protein [Bacillus thuringiensis]PEF03424.1 hypothetical protein COM97_27165 [Bacillus thuringiensis]
MENKIYEIIIVDSVVQRNSLNHVLNQQSSKYYKVEAVVPGEVIRGRRFGHQRINLVNDRTAKRPANYHWWYNHVRPFLAPDCRFK